MTTAESGSNSIPPSQSATASSNIHSNAMPSSHPRNPNMAEFRLSANIPSHLFPSSYTSNRSLPFTTSTMHSNPYSDRILTSTHEGFGQFDRTFMRHCRRSRGPRLVPLLIVGGVGYWAYSRTRAQAEDLRQENEALRSTIVMRNNGVGQGEGAHASVNSSQDRIRQHRPRSWAPWSHGHREHRAGSQQPSVPVEEQQRYV
ncbi:hypothetical protein OIO90_002160 [Microbotryomycetes sp. JL221]|nr:hypothetical protein OIO90_002160 [Microbotryomycetes sp. JL221]